MSYRLVRGPEDVCPSAIRAKRRRARAQSLLIQRLVRLSFSNRPTKLTFRGLWLVSKDRKIRIKAIAEYIASQTYDIVCLQELWMYEDFLVVRNEVEGVLPFSRFFHT